MGIPRAGLMTYQPQVDRAALDRRVAMNDNSCGSLGSGPLHTRLLFYLPLEACRTGLWMESSIPQICPLWCPIKPQACSAMCTRSLLPQRDQSASQDACLVSFISMPPPSVSIELCLGDLSLPYSSLSFLKPVQWRAWLLAQLDSP